MPRTCLRFPFYAGFETVDNTIRQILMDEGFSEKNISGELCWKKGTGMMTAMQYVKVEYTQNEVVLFGWLQAGIGSLAGPEMELTGNVYAIPKKNLMKRLNKIQQAVMSLR